MFIVTRKDRGQIVDLEESRAPWSERGFRQTQVSRCDYPSRCEVLNLDIFIGPEMGTGYSIGGRCDEKSS
jgi:hypothetical protein